MNGFEQPQIKKDIGEGCEIYPCWWFNSNHFVLWPLRELCMNMYVYYVENPFSFACMYVQCHPEWKMKTNVFEKLLELKDWVWSDRKGFLAWDFPCGESADYTPTKIQLSHPSHSYSLKSTHHTTHTTHHKHKHKHNLHSNILLLFLLITSKVQLFLLPVLSKRSIFLHATRPWFGISKKLIIYFPLLLPTTCSSSVRCEASHFSIISPFFPQLIYYI